MGKAKNKEKQQLNIAMIGHKIVPSRIGGVELVLTTLCPMLADKGIDVTCYNRSNDEYGKEYIVDVKDGCYKNVRLKKVMTIDKKGLSAVSSSFFASIKATFGGYDLIHYHAEGPCAMMWIPKLFRRKCVATVHGLDWQREKWQHGIGSKVIKFGEKILAKYADEIIVLSKPVQDYFKETYGRDTVFIPNGVNKPMVRPANIIKEKFGLDKDSYFCGLSRLTEEKGVHYLIEAYKKLETDKKLVIAGGTSDTDEYVARLKEMAGDNQNIIFTGFVSGELLDELYSNAYAYILPSNLEGMPLSLLEAMSYGNAVIGSSIPEIANVVEDKALIFEKSNVEDLKDKLQLLIGRQELVEQLRTQSADFILERYNWENVADRTIELYKKALDR